MSDGFSRPGFKYSHRAGAVAAAQVKLGGGILRGVTFGTTGATPGTVTLADNTVPDATTNVITIIVPAANATPVTYELDVVFNNGLTYTNVGGTTADVTIAYI